MNHEKCRIHRVSMHHVAVVRCDRCRTHTLERRRVHTQHRQVLVRLAADKRGVPRRVVRQRDGGLRALARVSTPSPRQVRPKLPGGKGPGGSFRVRMRRGNLLCIRNDVEIGNDVALLIPYKARAGALRDLLQAILPVRLRRARCTIAAAWPQSCLRPGLSR